MNRLFLMKLHKTSLLIYMSLSLLLIFSFNIVLKSVDTTSPNYSPKIAYYDGNNKSSLVKSLKENNITYGYTMPTHIYKGEKFNADQYTVMHKLDQSVNLRKLSYLTSSSPSLAKSNNNAILNGNNEQTFNLNFMLYPEFIGHTKTVFSTATGDLVTGELPNNSSEIIIPENYALSLIESENMNSYKDLLNTDIQLSKDALNKTYTITGITLSNNFYTIPNSAEKKSFLLNHPNSEQDIFIKFKSLKERNKFIKNNNYKFEINNILSLNNIVMLIPYGLILILQILMNVILLKYVLRIARKLNINYWRPSNYFYPWIIPACLINLIFIFCLIHI